MFAICGYQLCRDQVVTGRAVLGHQHAFASSERETRNAYRWATCQRCREAMALRRCIHMNCQRAGLRMRDSLGRVDDNPMHHRGIDDHAAIARAESGAIVPSAAHSYAQIVALSEVEGPSNIRRDGTSNYQCRMKIECT